jgi:glycine/D-amino acid oxidase-like deaminating enzyme
MLRVTEAPQRAISAQRRIYWRDTEPVEYRPALTADIKCDVCIVGGGYTGLWTARFLKEADSSLNVHVLEADYAGAGASGHNDGIVTSAIGAHSLPTLSECFGDECANYAHRAVTQSMVEIARFCKHEGIDAEAELAGSYLVATSEQERNHLADGVSRLADLGQDRGTAKLLDTTDMQLRIGSPHIVSGIWNSGLLLNPHKLARGLSRSVQRAGTVIHEQTPVVDVHNEGHAVLVRTPKAQVNAAHVVLATNAWQGQFREFRRRVLPVWHHVLVTEPLSAADLEEANWRHRAAYISVGKSGNFFRLTLDNRILFSGAGWFAADANTGPSRSRTAQAERSLRRAFRRFFPMLSHIQFTHFYGGAIGLTSDRLPSVGQVSPRITYAYGYSGNGIATTHAVAAMVRDIVLRKHVDCKLARVFQRPAGKPFPPIPMQLITARSLTVSQFLAHRALRQDLL